jgi:magnesium transporter
VLQVHLNLQQMQVNHVIKVLSVLATLFMPVLVVTSYYGMNLMHWPGPDNPNGWAWVWGFTGGTTALLYGLLKKRGWL